MKYLLPVFVLAIIVLSFLYTGCNPSSSDQGSAILRGIVMDTSLPSQPKVIGATVLLEEANLTTTTNDSGMFILRNIQGGFYTLTITKAGYTKSSTRVEIISDDTNQFITVPLLFKRIYSFSDIVLDLNNAGKFTNPAGTVPDYETNKDVQIRDTLVDPDTLTFLRSADLDLINVGFQTWFSGQKYVGYTQSQFDTLSQYRTDDGLMRPEDRDFPYHSGLDNFINVNNYQNAVWFFYLRGRGIGSQAIYGALYLDAAWNENGVRRIRVDIKINANGKYIFDPNLK